MLETQHIALSEAFQGRAKAHLKKTIKALSAKIRQLRCDARTTYDVVEPKPYEGIAHGTGWKKHELKLEARRMGTGCVRPRHLALGLLRGVPYRAMEQHTHDNAYDLARLRWAIQKMLTEAFGLDVSDLYTLDAIEAWMAYEPARSCCCAA